MMLEEKAAEVAQYLEEELQRQERRAPVTIDPITIGIILTILIELIKLYMTCSSEAGAVKSLASPSWWQLLLMRRKIRNNIQRTKLRGCEDEVESAILKSGKETTVSDMEGFYAEVKGE